MSGNAIWANGSGLFGNKQGCPFRVRGYLPLAEAQYNQGLWVFGFCYLTVSPWGKKKEEWKSCNVQLLYLTLRRCKENCLLNDSSNALFFILSLLCIVKGFCVWFLFCSVRLLMYVPFSATAVVVIEVVLSMELARSEVKGNRSLPWGVYNPAFKTGEKTEREMEASGSNWEEHVCISVTCTFYYTSREWQPNPSLSSLCI